MFINGNLPLKIIKAFDIRPVLIVLIGLGSQTRLILGQDYALVKSLLLNSFREKILPLYILRQNKGDYILKDIPGQFIFSSDSSKFHFNQGLP